MNSVNQEKTDFAKEEERLKSSAKFKHLTFVSDRCDTKTIHANIRKDLKKHFPLVKFSVRGDYHTVNIEWTDGVRLDDVNKLLLKFKSGTVDSHTDIFEFIRSSFIELFGGKKYIICKRHFSDRSIENAIAIVKNRYNELNQVKITVEEFRRGHYHSYSLKSYHESLQRLISNTLHESTT